MSMINLQPAYGYEIISKIERHPVIAEKKYHLSIT